MPSYFKQSTEIEQQITCSLSTSVLSGGGSNLSILTVILTPTFPLSSLISEPSARAKNLKKNCNFSSLIVFLTHAHRHRNPPSRTSFTARFERQTGLRRFLRLFDTGVYSEQSFAFQGSQTANFGKKPRDTEYQKCFCFQLEKLSRCRGRFNEVLRANQGDRRCVI